MTVVEENRDDTNYEPLQENLARLRAMKVDGAAARDRSRCRCRRRSCAKTCGLPASYANFYIANESVLLPTFAIRTMRRRIVDFARDFSQGAESLPIDCRELIWGLGAFHCLTQQQPATLENQSANGAGL